MTRNPKSSDAERFRAQIATSTDPAWLERRAREVEQHDPLAPWICLDCRHEFPIGRAMLRGGKGPDVPGNVHRLNCPACRSVNIHRSTAALEAATVPER